MSRLIFLAFTTFLSVNVFATQKSERVLHDCIVTQKDSLVSQVSIRNTSELKSTRTFLEVFGNNSELLKRYEVQYQDDMTYIVYVNEAEEVYFVRDWPVRNGRGTGTLSVAFGDKMQRTQKVYDLHCIYRDSSGHKGLN